MVYAGCLGVAITCCFRCFGLVVYDVVLVAFVLALE